MADQKLQELAKRFQEELDQDADYIYGDAAKEFFAYLKTLSAQ